METTQTLIDAYRAYQAQVELHNGQFDPNILDTYINLEQTPQAYAGEMIVTYGSLLGACKAMLRVAMEVQDLSDFHRQSATVLLLTEETDG
jgi:hypothetical protein